ncbi:MAG: hypothetical protein KF857_11835 [Fimbriimonadaceae bacterium]|nr:hypothetical protein [Fimbriimonadaceae bacterium]
MLDKEILRKLREEQPLTAAETLRLDESLEAGASRAHQLLDGLDDAAPSYAWRSSLNQRLVSTKRHHAPRLKLFIGWAGGLTAVAASALAMVMTQNSAKPTPAPDHGPLAKSVTPSSFEETLVSSHLQGANQSSVSTVPVQSAYDQVFDWSKLDKS